MRGRTPHYQTHLRNLGDVMMGRLDLPRKLRLVNKRARAM